MELLYSAIGGTATVIVFMFATFSTKKSVEMNHKLLLINIQDLRKHILLIENHLMNKEK